MAGWRPGGSARPRRLDCREGDQSAGGCWEWDVGVARAESWDAGLHGETNPSPSTPTAASVSGFPHLPSTGVAPTLASAPLRTGLIRSLMGPTTVARSTARVRIRSPAASAPLVYASPPKAHARSFGLRMI